MKAGDLLISVLILVFFVNFIAFSFSNLEVYQPSITENTTFIDNSKGLEQSIKETEEGVYAFANTTYTSSDLLTQLQVAFGLGTYIIFGMLRTFFLGIIQTPIILISTFINLLTNTNNPILLTLSGIILPLITGIITIFLIILIIRIFTQRADVWKE